MMSWMIWRQRRLPLLKKASKGASKKVLNKAYSDTRMRVPE